MHWLIVVITLFPRVFNHWREMSLDCFNTNTLISTLDPILLRKLHQYLHHFNWSLSDNVQRKQVQKQRNLMHLLVGNITLRWWMYELVFLCTNSFLFQIKTWSTSSTMSKIKLGPVRIQMRITKLKRTFYVERCIRRLRVGLINPSYHNIK